MTQFFPNSTILGVLVGWRVCANRATSKHLQANRFGQGIEKVLDACSTVVLKKTHQAPVTLPF